MKTKKNIKCPVREVGDGQQKSLFGPFNSTSKTTKKKPYWPGNPHFLEPDKENKIYINEISIENLLVKSNQEWVIVLKKFLQKFDWTPFTQKYSLVGRSPMGAILFLGIIKADV